jgi:hypothetical protein
MNYKTLSCPECGEKIEPSFLHCPHCGRKITHSTDISEDAVKDFKRKLFRENLGWFIFIGIIIVFSLCITVYQLAPLVEADLSLKNPVILYSSATLVYLICLYTFQFKKKFGRVIYFSLLLFSIAYSAFFAYMMYEPGADFINYIGPVFTILMIFSPFIIGRKNISIR